MTIELREILEILLLNIHDQTAIKKMHSLFKNFYKWHSEDLCFIFKILNLHPDASLCHQYRTRLICSSLEYNQTLYCWLVILLSPKLIMDNSKQGMK